MSKWFAVSYEFIPRRICELNSLLERQTAKGFILKQKKEEEIQARFWYDLHFVYRVERMFRYYTLKSFLWLLNIFLINFEFLS